MLVGVKKFIRYNYVSIRLIRNQHQHNHDERTNERTREEKKTKRKPPNERCRLYVNDIKIQCITPTTVEHYHRAIRALVMDMVETNKYTHTTH